MAKGVKNVEAKTTLMNICSQSVDLLFLPFLEFIGKKENNYLMYGCVTKYISHVYSSRSIEPSTCSTLVTSHADKAQIWFYVANMATYSCQD